jgi:hypothetical protein
MTRGQNTNNRQYRVIPWSTRRDAPIHRRHQSIQELFGEIFDTSSAFGPDITMTRTAANDHTKRVTNGVSENQGQ